jgi:hypothetical protein
MAYQAATRKRKQERDQVFRRVDRVVNNDLTIEKKLSDFPDVHKYICSKFPDVDLSVVKFYLVLPKVMSKAGWKDIGGCYVRDKKVILVKTEINNQSKSKGQFQRLMREVCHMKADVEDVVVHEFIHAVSDIIGRSLAKYRHVEEEFVYTNCLDFYYQKGMSDEDVVNNNFLPFCIQDIYESPKDMKSLFVQIGSTIDEVRQMGEEEYTSFLNLHAKELVPLIKKAAQDKAHKMIELYHKFGAKMYKMSSTESVEDSVSMRFSSLDLE